MDPVIPMPSASTQAQQLPLALNDDSEICAVMQGASQAQTTLQFTNSSSGHGSFGSKKNVKGLSLVINDSNKTASSNNSQKTVVDRHEANSQPSPRFNESEITTANISEPQLTSSRIETPSCYGSAEPSPADEVAQQKQLNMQNFTGQLLNGQPFAPLPLTRFPF